MKKAIFYTVCSYPEELKQVLDNILPIVKGMAKWAEYKGVDFKCFTEIPDEVEDLFQQVQNKWNLPWDNKIKKHARKSKTAPRSSQSSPLGQLREKAHAFSHDSSGHQSNSCVHV